jgi:imidazolonepropionase-like amidohydrolase
MGPNTAAAIGKGGELGTLEPGKTADMVIVEGDPLEDVFNLTHVVLVVKDGKVLSDTRGRHRNTG